ncbi:MAG: hypothetical protein K6E86_03720 [Bacteroidales bacterium]|nr:hypothetical protein [Bacteroidales bacterium]
MNLLINNLEGASAGEYEYELISFDWNLNYDYSQLEPFPIVNDDTNQGNSGYPCFECDKEGVPMDQTIEAIRKREEIIDAFFRKWYEEHPAREVYNNRVNNSILVRKVSIDEAKQHASKRYLSTVAIIHHFEEILANAISVGKTAVKPNDRNQSSFDYMLIMSYQCQNIGLVKLTVGIRKKKAEDGGAQEIMTEYGVSVMQDGHKIEVPRKADKKKKKASRHR